MKITGVDYENGNVVAVDVEGVDGRMHLIPVVHGHWEIAIGYDPSRKFQCSVCYRMAYEPSRYCPHCGAKLGERKDGDSDG